MSDADSLGFLRLLEKLEKQHWREVGALDPDQLGCSVFHNLVQDVIKEFKKQVKLWERKVVAIEDGWQEQLATLSREIADLRRQNDQELPSAQLNGRSNLDQLWDQLNKGAPPQEVANTLNTIDMEVNLDDEFARQDTEERGLLHGCLPCQLYDSRSLVTTMKLLAERRCDPERQSRSGQTPLGYAAAHRDASVIKTLLSMRASPTPSDIKDESPLRICVGKSDVDSVKVLLERRADPNAADPFGETALMEAAGQDNLKMCALLLKHRADPQARNNFELSATDFADDDTVLDLLTSHSPLATLPQQSSAVQDAIKWTIHAEDVRAIRKGGGVHSPVYNVPGIFCPVSLTYQPKGGVDDEKGTVSIELRSRSPCLYPNDTVTVKFSSPTWEKIIFERDVHLDDEIARFKFKPAKQAGDDLRGDVSISLRPGTLERHLDILFR